MVCNSHWLRTALAVWLVGGFTLLATSASAVGTRRIAIRTAEAFAEGELSGVAVDSTGKLRAGYDLADVPVSDATSVWAALDLGAGRILLATGNEGKLVEFSNGATRVVADSEAMVLTSLARGWGQRVFVGALPGGKIFEYKAGELKEWVTLPDEAQIFQLVFDSKQQVLYAATGSDGKLYRITADGKAQVYFDAPEQHLASVAVGNNSVYVGAGDKAKLYEVTGPGRSSVIYDFDMTEVHAIQVASNGDVYAIANEIKSGKSLPSGSSESSTKKGSSSGKGVLYRFNRGEIPEQLLDVDDEHLVSLALDPNGRPVVGTGEKGRVYTIDEQHNSVLLADVEQRQVTSVLYAPTGTLVIGSDPVVVHPVRGIGGADAMWTSDVIDAGIRARFGRLGAEGVGRVEFETRTGNTEEPDESWGPWSAAAEAPTKVTSSPARFLQIRARFGKDQKAVVREVNVAFVTDNLKATLTDIEVENASSEAFSAPDDKLGSSGGPVSSKPENEVSLSWKVDNPDKDDLRFRLWYSPLDQGQWFELTKPHERWTKTSYTWDTADLPEGKYRVRVEASDELANPPDRVTRDQLESHVIVVDNTAPVIEGLKIVGRRARLRVTDGVGPIARLEVAVAGSDDWFPFEPTDGVFDDPSETFDLDLTQVSPTGPAMLTVRAYDQENNQVVGNILLR